MAKLSHDLLGKRFVTKLCYKPVVSNKVLVICNLPDLVPGVIKQSMELIVRRKTKAVIDKFAVAENTAYITFCDSSGNWHVFVTISMLSFNLAVCSTHSNSCVCDHNIILTCWSNNLCENCALLTIALYV